MSVLDKIVSFFRPTPVPDHVAEYKEAAERIVDASDQIVRRLNEEPMDDWLSDIRERKPKSHERQRRKVTNRGKSCNNGK